MTNQILAKVRNWARAIKRDILALWLAARDSRTPWYAKAVAAFVAAYALSPIDLIPDFIPILGYLDDAILLPLGILLAIRLVPPEVMAEMRARASQQADRPRSLVAAVVIVILWLVITISAGLWFSRKFG